MGSEGVVLVLSLEDVFFSVDGRAIAVPAEPTARFKWLVLRTRRQRSKYTKTLLQAKMTRPHLET